MFLATTALSEFWETQEEMLFLGPWCLRHSRRSSWEKLAPKVVPDPWSDPETARAALAEAATAYENLLRRLADRMNRIHGTGHGLRYWRIVLGPWLLGYVSSFCDRDLHLRAALKVSPGLRTLALDPRDYTVPRDTAEANAWRSGDRFNLQIYSEVAAYRGVPAETRRLPTPPPDARAPAGRGKTAVYDALFRLVSAPKRDDGRAYFSDLYLDRVQTLRLIAASGFRLTPVLKQLAPDFRFAPLDSPERRALAEAPGAEGGFEGLLAASLPTQLPTVFLEGYGALRQLVLRDWPRLPGLLLTSVGYFYNEYFKLLAAESTERGGRLVIAQHGGGYGMQALRDNERHERAVADLYATWGWKDDFAPGAELQPLPNPRLAPSAPRRASNSGDWLMICGTLPRYPYSWYFAEKGASSRFGESLDWRRRFLEALPADQRKRLHVRLHDDLGWDQRERLEEIFPDLVFDRGGPWVKRRDRFGLIVIDHPQTSMLEALAMNIPTLLFWDPELWPARPSARPLLDDLRRAGILRNTPEAAAESIAAMKGDPSAWWRAEAVQKARERFRMSFAYGSRDWAAIWTSRLSLNAPRPA